MERTAGATGPQGIGHRAWLVGLILVGAFVAIAAMAMVLIGDRQDTVYDPDSPEAAVQAYTQAWEGGDVDAAWQVLTPRAQERVEWFEFQHAATWSEESPTRMWVAERDDHVDYVVLTLSIERTWDGLLGPDRDVQSLRLRLVRLDGSWRIDSPIAGFYPW